MWMVNPRILCRQHLLGEHNEIHKHRHIFEKHYSIKGRFGQIQPESMKSRHDELVAEMISRGFKHNTPYSQPDLSYLPDNDRKGMVDKEENIRELMKRCPVCKSRMVRFLVNSNLLQPVHGKPGKFIAGNGTTVTLKDWNELQE